MKQLGLVLVPLALSMLFGLVAWLLTETAWITTVATTVPIALLRPILNAGEVTKILDHSVALPEKGGSRETAAATGAGRTKKVRDTTSPESRVPDLPRRPRHPRMRRRAV